MIGRDGAVEALSVLLASRRFVSVVGPGGLGKTTVAVAVAHALLDDFGDAIHFVDLSAIKDATLVPNTVATVLGVLVQAQDPLPSLLATSRESLRVEGEHVHLLAPLDYPAAKDDLTAAEALASTMALAQLWSSQGKATDAAELLEDIYRRFSEGHDTVDLRHVGHLLATLDGPLRKFRHSERKPLTGRRDLSRLTRDNMPSAAASGSLLKH